VVRILVPAMNLMFNDWVSPTARVYTREKFTEMVQRKLIDDGSGDAYPSNGTYADLRHRINLHAGEVCPANAEYVAYYPRAMPSR
jgi:hypothetical protein